MCVNFLYLLFFVFGFSEAVPFYRIDYTFNTDAGGWLKVHEVPTDFKTAFLQCDFEGAVLASPSNTHLLKALQAVHPRAKENCAMYVGIYSLISGDYTTVDGIPLDHLSVTWVENEPDNFKNQENCLIMMPNGALADVSCNETHPYACFKKETKTLGFTECGTTDLDYKLDSRTGSCYKFYRVGTTWKVAQKICLADGGHLAIINSETEAGVLRDIFSRVQANSIEATWKNVASIGFLNWNGDRLWYTVQGQKLHEAGYSTWEPNQPDVPKTYCGGVTRSGRLDDIWCDHFNYAFICELLPESLMFKQWN